MWFFFRMGDSLIRTFFSSFLLQSERETSWQMHFRIYIHTEWIVLFHASRKKWCPCPRKSATFICFLLYSAIRALDKPEHFSMHRVKFKQMNCIQCSASACAPIVLQNAHVHALKIAKWNYPNTDGIIYPVFVHSGFHKSIGQQINFPRTQPDTIGGCRQNTYENCSISIPEK